MTAAERSALVARYKAGAAEVTTALQGITPAELDWRPAPADWSARQVVHHLADSETIAGARLRLLLTADHAQIVAYDQEALARRLHYESRPIEAALAVLQALRATTAELLDGLAEADWRRSGTHTEMGAYSVERWLELNAAHAHDHAEQIRRNRAAWAPQRR
jgi:DinB superfamily